MEVRSKWRQLHCYHPIETSLWVTSQKMQLHCKMDLRVISTDKGCVLAMDHKCHTSITPLWIKKIRNHFLKLCCLRQLLVKIYTGLKKSLKKHPKNNKNYVLNSKFHLTIKILSCKLKFQITVFLNMIITMMLVLASVFHTCIGQVVRLNRNFAHFLKFQFCIYLLPKVTAFE